MRLPGPLSLPLLLLLAGCGLTGADWTSNCTLPCKCKWVSSRKTAECNNGSLSAVPADLSSEVQALDLSGNAIPVLTNNAFSEVGLVNLQKLFLRDCNIEKLGKRAFSKLAILMGLDLSYNQISELHPSMFNENEKLRFIYLGHNQIQKVPNGVFSDLQHLQTVDLNDNLITQLGDNSFTNLPLLNSLKLHSNRLTTMQPEPFYPLAKLKSLELHNNPWRCDCQLTSLCDWTIKNNLYNSPTKCEEPEKFRDLKWTEISSDELACAPHIIMPYPGQRFEAIDGEVTMPCQVEGNPVPTVHWVRDSRVLGNDSDKLVLHEGQGGWFNITLLNIGPEDRGEYKCVAKNLGGVDERNVSVLVDGEAEPFLDPKTGVTSDADEGGAGLLLIVALAVGAALMAGFLIGLSCWLCRSGRICKMKKASGDNSSSNGNANSMNDEQEKGLITKINPVQKPPRRIDTGSTAGDLAEMKMTLLDNGSIISPSVADSEDPAQERSLDSLDSTLGGGSGQRPRGPPDLLSFPGQVSPAGSSASTVPDSSRLPPQHGPQSPPPPPYVMVSPHLFGTLPYSRSQSPFSPAVAPVPPRSTNGYVTIPRRPRVPSWSSPPTPLQLQLELPARRPVYDNLGPRTTADGSSVLSLNRAGLPTFYSPVPPTVEDGAWSSRATPESVGLPPRLEDVASQSDLPASAKVIKVPPKPPPKPKKKSADSVSGPLYEDEGEDGTEV